MRLTWYHCYLMPAVIVILAVSIFPMLYNIYLSVHQVLLYSTNPNPPFNGLANYVSLINSPDFHNSLIVTALYTVGTVALSLTVGLGLALLMSQGLRGTNLFRAVIILPLTIPPVVTGFAWRFLLNDQLGLLGAYLLPLLGFHVRTILGDPAYALLAVVFVDVWAKSPLTFLILLAGILAVPPQLYDAAKVDGASSLATFTRITLPLIRPSIILAMLIKTIDSVNAFDIIYTMTSGGPGSATQSLAMFGWRVAFSQLDMGLATALAVLMIVITGFVLAFMIRYLPR